MLYFPIIVSIFSLFFVFFLAKQLQGQKVFSEGSKLSRVIREGAAVFLKRQYRTIAIVAIPLFFLLWFIFGFKSSFAFLLGIVASAVAGFVGMTVSLKSNLGAAEAVKAGLKKSLEIFFKSGSVVGLSVVGLALLAVSVFYLFTNDLKALIFLGLGGSLVSIFARIGGGVFAKAIDVGLDPGGKTGVGKNISGCFGMAADLFETNVITLVSAMILAGALFSIDSPLVLLPILLGTTGILASIIGSFFVSLGKKQNIMSAIYKSLAASLLLMAVGFYPSIKKIISLSSISISGNKIYLASLIGLVVIATIFIVTEYFVSKRHQPVKKIASASQNGQANNIIIGSAMAMRSTILPGLLISSGISASFWLAGSYGVALAAVATASLAGIMVSLYVFGLMAGNAPSFFEIADANEDDRKVADILGSFSNTAKALASIYGIVSAGLASLIVFFNFSQELIISRSQLSFSLNDPKVIAGLFLGGLLCYFFVFLVVTAVNKTADGINRYHLQSSKEEPRPDYTGAPGRGKWLDAAAKTALKEALIIGLILVLSPIVVGFMLGSLVLAGVLVGSILIGLFLGISMILGGIVLSNARKYIEEGNYGGKDSLARQAAIIGEAVAAPYKDTVGSSLGSLLKVVNIVALLIVSFLF